MIATKLIVISILLITMKNAIGTPFPVAIFHGMGDACANPGMHHFTKYI